MEEFRAQLNELGITPETVDLTSMAGGDHPTKGSKWKTYYRAKDFPTFGVLLAYADLPTAPLSVREQRLSDEARNARDLLKVGHNVMKMEEVAAEVFDWIKGEQAMSLIVEHCQGPGPYKALFGAKSLMKVANGFPPSRLAKAKASWQHLRLKAPELIARDLQIMFHADGTIMIMDPELVYEGADLALPDWDDSLVVG